MRAFRIISLISVSGQPTTSAFYFVQRTQLLGAEEWTPQCPVVTILLKLEAPLIQASNDFSHLLALHCAGCVFALTGRHSAIRARGVLYLLCRVN